MVSRARTTVVIATRGRAATLITTLEALLALRPKPPVIVLDAASPDDTASRVHELREQHDDLRLIRLPGKDLAVGRNLGADLATTPYVAFCADDTWFGAGALPLAEELLDAYPALGLLAPAIMDEDGQRLDPACAAMAASRLGQPDQLPGPEVLGFPARAAVVRRDAFLHAGGFDPMLHLGAVETLLAYELAGAGWLACYAGSVEACHGPDSVGEASRRERSLRLRDDVLLAWLRRPRRVSMAATGRLLRDATHDPAAARAALGALRRLAWSIVERQEVPAALERKIQRAGSPSSGQRRGRCARCRAASRSPVRGGRR